jgi:hypothetical protein
VAFLQNGDVAATPKPRLTFRNNLAAKPVSCFRV